MNYNCFFFFKRYVIIKKIFLYMNNEIEILKKGDLGRKKKKSFFS